VAFASFSWVMAHSLAMVAFVLLALGLLGQYIRLQETTVENRAIQALVLSWIRIGLTLPYYGSETFGLHAIGQEAIKQKNPALLSIVNSLRLGEGLCSSYQDSSFLQQGLSCLRLPSGDQVAFPHGLAYHWPLALHCTHSILRAAVDQGSSRIINHDCIHLIAWSMLKHKEVVGRT
jgi:hypothetical protein